MINAGWALAPGRALQLAQSAAKHDPFEPPVVSSKITVRVR